MINLIVNISGRILASFCIGLLLAVPIAALTSSGFWAAVGTIAFGFFVFGPTD